MVVTRAITLPLLILNFSLYMVVLALAGWVMNMAIDTDFTTVTESSTTIYFMIFALIAGAVGMASVLSGFHHMHAWTLESFSASAATAIVALMLTLEALGLASKEINSGAFRHPTLKALEALVIIVGGTQLFYVITLQLGKISGEFS